MPYSAQNIELKRASSRRYKERRRTALGLPPPRAPMTRDEAYQKRLADNAKWRKNNPDKMQQYADAYAHRHLNRRMWSVAKQRAKRKGVPFSISYDDIVIPEFCPALGIRLVCGIGTTGRPGGNHNSPSLDRIDPALGYVAGNVRVISHLANTMKGAASREQLIKFANWVLSNE